MLSEVVNILNSSKIDWSLVISIIALSASLLTYILHDRRIKKQEHLLNSYQLQKISEEQTERTKAFVKANIIKLDKGKRLIKVFNTGKSRAKNIDLEILSGKDNFYGNNMNELFPYEFLNPQEGTEFYIFIMESSSNTIKIKITWDDEHKNGNHFEQILTL